MVKRLITDTSIHLAKFLYDGLFCVV